MRCGECEEWCSFEELTRRNQTSLLDRLIHFSQGSDEVRVLTRIVKCIECDGAGKTPVSQVSEYCIRKNIKIQLHIGMTVQHESGESIMEFAEWQMGAETGEPKKHQVAQKVLDRLRSLDREQLTLIAGSIPLEPDAREQPPEPESQEIVVSSDDAMETLPDADIEDF